MGVQTITKVWQVCGSLLLALCKTLFWLQVKNLYHRNAILKWQIRVGLIELPPKQSFAEPKTKLPVAYQTFALV